MLQIAMWHGSWCLLVIRTCGMLQIYDEDELLQAKLDILNKTNMIDYTIDIRKQLYPNVEVPEVCFAMLLATNYSCARARAFWKLIKRV